MDTLYCFLCPPLSPVLGKVPSPTLATWWGLQPPLSQGPGGSPGPVPQPHRETLFILRVRGTAGSHEFSSGLIELGLGDKLPSSEKQPGCQLGEREGGAEPEQTGTADLEKVCLYSAVEWFLGEGWAQQALPSGFLLWQIPSRRGRRLRRVRAPRGIVSAPVGAEVAGGGGGGLLCNEFLGL